GLQPRRGRGLPRLRRRVALVELGGQRHPRPPPGRLEAHRAARAVALPGDGGLGLEPGDADLSESPQAPGQSVGIGQLGPELGRGLHEGSLGGMHGAHLPHRAPHSSFAGYGSKRSTCPFLPANGPAVAGRPGSALQFDTYTAPSGSTASPAGKNSFPAPITVRLPLRATLTIRPAGFCLRKFVLNSLTNRLPSRPNARPVIRLKPLA